MFATSLPALRSEVAEGVLVVSSSSSPKRGRVSGVYLRFCDWSVPLLSRRTSCWSFYTGDVGSVHVGVTWWALVQRFGDSMHDFLSKRKCAPVGGSALIVVAFSAWVESPWRRRSVGRSPSCSDVQWRFFTCFLSGDLCEFALLYTFLLFGEVTNRKWNRWDVVWVCAAATFWPSGFEGAVRNERDCRIAC